MTSTKLFIWCGSRRCEERNGSGVLTKQFFASGQTVSGTKYFYSRDHLGSIREVSDNSGIVQARYTYNSFGQVTSIQGSFVSDFQFTGFYKHAPSGLSLSLYRPYSDQLGSWLNRDLMGEPAGLNLYGYANNNPLSFVDPLGLATKEQECCYGSAKTRNGRINLVGDLLYRAVMDAGTRFAFQYKQGGYAGVAKESGEGLNQSESTFVGNVLDQYFKDEVRKDKCLKILVEVVPRGKFGPDVFSRDLDYWWDLTTKKIVDAGTHNVYPTFGRQGAFIGYQWFPGSF